jgi:hypothetical protein
MREQISLFRQAGWLSAWAPARAVLVNLELVLLVDVLGSIDDARVALQRDDFINTTSVPGS